jgi:hypothetical protein
MSHFRASLIHGHGASAEADMVIEVDAPSITDAADVLFTAANRGANIPSGVQVIQPLMGLPMTIGDMAAIFDMDAPVTGLHAVRCEVEGWREL